MAAAAGAGIPAPDAAGDDSLPFRESNGFVRTVCWHNIAIGQGVDLVTGEPKPIGHSFSPFEQQTWPEPDMDPEAAISVTYSISIVEDSESFASTFSSAMKATGTYGWGAASLSASASSSASSHMSGATDSMHALLSLKVLRADERVSRDFLQGLTLSEAALAKLAEGEEAFCQQYGHGVVVGFQRGATLDAVTSEKFSNSQSREHARQSLSAAFASPGKPATFAGKGKKKRQTVSAVPAAGVTFDYSLSIGHDDAASHKDRTATVWATNLPASVTLPESPAANSVLGWVSEIDWDVATQRLLAVVVPWSELGVVCSQGPVPSELSAEAARVRQMAPLVANRIKVLVGNRRAPPSARTQIDAINTAFIDLSSLRAALPYAVQARQLEELYCRCARAEECIPLPPGAWLAPLSLRADGGARADGEVSDTRKPGEYPGICCMEAAKAWICSSEGTVRWWIVVYPCESVAEARRLAAGWKTTCYVVFAKNGREVDLGDRTVGYSPLNRLRKAFHKWLAKQAQLGIVTCLAGERLE